MGDFVNRPGTIYKIVLQTVGLFMPRCNSELAEQSPHDHHHRLEPHLLAADFVMNNHKLPLREGRIHFIRQVQADATVRVLNVDWVVPNRDLLRGVWVTIHFQPIGTMLSIYDAAPDVLDRKCLTTYAFPLQEPVFGKQEDSLDALAKIVIQSGIAQSAQSFSRDHQVVKNEQRLTKGYHHLVETAIYHTARLTERVWHTIY